MELLAAGRDSSLQQRAPKTGISLVDTVVAREEMRQGDFEEAIALSRAVVDELFDSGGRALIPMATAVLVEALLQRGGDGDIDYARAAIDRLANMPTDPGLVLQETWLLRLRALLARARGDQVAYRDYRDRYRTMATDLGFEGHMAMAEALA